MIRRTTWIYLAFFVVLLGFAWYFQNSKEKAAAQITPTPGAQNLFNIEESSIKSLKIEDNQGNIVALGRDEKGLWSLTEPKAEMTDISQAESAVSQLVSLTILSSVDPAPAADVTGLNPAVYTVTIDFNDGTQKVLQVGKVTPIQNGYYSQLDGGPVNVVNKYGMDAFLKLLSSPPIATPTPVPTSTSVPENTATPQP
jgi:hypothetical protein